MYELYAQSPQEFRPTIASWLDLIHPDDRQSAQAAITGACASTASCDPNIA